MDRFASERPERRKLVMLGTSLVLLLSFALGMRFALPMQQVPAGDEDFPSLRPMLEVLRDVCAREPGVVLADPNVGHYVRYYTEWSVISNNFLPTKQGVEKVALGERLLSSSADEMPAAAPYVRHVLVRPDGVETSNESYRPYSSKRLIQDLLLKPIGQVSDRYALLREVGIQTNSPDRTIPFIRLFKVTQLEHIDAPARARLSTLHHPA